MLFGPKHRATAGRNASAANANTDDGDMIVDIIVLLYLFFICQ